MVATKDHPAFTMTPPGALPLVEAVEKIFDLYNECNPDLAKFHLTTNSPLLLTVSVFKALLHHAIAPSSVAKNFWEFLSPHFHDVLEEHDDPTVPQSLILRPLHGEWTTVRNKLLQMTEGTLDHLTEEMNHHAREWMITLLLPSTFISPITFERSSDGHSQSAPAGAQVHS